MDNFNIVDWVETNFEEDVIKEILDLSVQFRNSDDFEDVLSGGFYDE